MKFPMDRPVKVVMLGAGGTGGYVAPYVCLEQPTVGRENVLYYRTVRHARDFKGGYNHFITRSELKKWSYSQLLDTLNALRKDGCTYEWAA